MSRKTEVPRVGLVGADPLEDARAVVQAVRADVDGRVGPVDELAVHPDLLRLAHRGSSLRSGAGPGIVPVRLRCRSAVRAFVSRTRSTGEIPTMWRSEPAPIQTGRGRGALRLDQNLRDARRRERRDAAGLEARRREDLVGPRDARVPRAGGRRDLVSSARRSPGTSASVGPAVADEDERLDDLRASVAPTAFAAAPRGRRALRELLDPRVDAGSLSTSATRSTGSGQRSTADRNAKPGDGRVRCLVGRRHRSKGDER